MFQMTGCMNCHSPEKNKPLAGGFKITTQFGNFYSPNISSDKNFGIGKWSDEDFLKAVKRGISPEKKFYYPAFPFTAYSKLTDEDVLAIKAYIMSLPPQAVANKPHELKTLFKNRLVLLPWRSINFRKHFNSKNAQSVYKIKGDFKANPLKSDGWNRGAYLTEAAFHCTECHTPRNALGGLETKKWMSGAPFDNGKEIATNITSDKKTGKGMWTRDDWNTFLNEGETPTGEIVDGDMWLVVKNGTSKLTDADREDVITYLQELKAVTNDMKSN